MCDYALQSFIMISQPLQGDSVDLSHEQWTEELNLQVKHLTRWEVKELFLYNNYRATLVSEITHIHFTALTWLSLSGNQIESIEGLGLMQMPQICHLLLWRNSIASVRVMRKAAWPALKQLNIGNNSFGDAKSLALGCFPQLQELYVYSWGDKNAFTEQSFPAKIEATCLQILQIRKNKLCCDRCITSVFQQKWLHIKIE